MKPYYIKTCANTATLKEAGKILHTRAIVYLGMAGVISLLIVSLAPLITEHWLQSKYLPQQTIVP